MKKYVVIKNTFPANWPTRDPNDYIILTNIGKTRWANERGGYGGDNIVKPNWNWSFQKRHIVEESDNIEDLIEKYFVELL